MKTVSKNNKDNKDNNFDPARLDALLDAIGRGADKVIPLLQAIQKEYNYLPEPALKYLSENSDISSADIIGVSTFYSQFRHTPAGRYDINVCVGTACHIKGAELVYDGFRRYLGCADGDDTDPQRLFTVNKVACLGCCSLAPAVQVGGVIYGHVTAAGAGDVVKDFLGRLGESKKDLKDSKDKKDKKKKASSVNEVRVCLGSCCAASGTNDIISAAREAVARYGLAVNVKVVGCVGMCHRTPLVEVVVGGVSHFYARTKADDVPGILLKHYRPMSIIGKASAGIDTAVESLLLSEPASEAAGRLRIGMDEAAVDNFFNRQVRVATEHYGAMTPLDIGEYVGKGGFEALKRCLNAAGGGLGADDVIEIVKDSGLRGRGGAGFSTGVKWEVVKRNSTSTSTSKSNSKSNSNSKSTSTSNSFYGDGGSPVTPHLKPHVEKDYPKTLLRGSGGWDYYRTSTSTSTSTSTYIICNGDEGDPGAFMDRMLLESFPYRIIEGMLIAAYAVGAKEGIFYIRAEYPAAISTIRRAIDECEKNGLLGDDILGSGFSFKLSIVEGAGAFVCGEETALIKSIEGKRGMPEPKPPYPAERGLWGKPTVINNCETFACVPWIVRNGAEKLREIGTEKSPGTKVFALAGKIARGGLIETPMGITLREIVEHIGGGIANGKKFKAVQVGGPSGGCIPARLCDVPVDYERLAGAGAMMGSGGLVALDERDCMVDIAKYFLTFTQDQSCGRCTFCRVGTKRMLDILEKICVGEGTTGDIETLEELALSVKKASLCGLGKTAPNPVLTTLKYFRDEYVAHINGECPAGKCKELISYKITTDCDGCTICAQECPVNAIAFTPYERHSVDDDLCTRCGVCLAVCPVGAVVVGGKNDDKDEKDSTGDGGLLGGVG